MTQRLRRSPEAIFTHVLLAVAFVGVLSVLKSAYGSGPIASSQSPVLGRRSQEVKNEECRLVHGRRDQCAFVKANCPDEEAGLISYLQLYFCTLYNAKSLAFVILATWISILFSTIGIAASDFLCLNLNTISTMMGMSESLAGVTFLAFGNGSSDVFSTFAAFSSHSGSLAVGELMGAAGFITAVVAGSMAITKPFRVAKKSFVRDVVLFAVAAAFSLSFLKDGKLRLWECCAMIGFYVAYVLFVVAWHWYFDRQRRTRSAETAARSHQHIPEQQELDLSVVEDDEEGRPAAERVPLIRTASGTSGPSPFTPGTPAWMNEHVDDIDEEVRDQYLAALSNNMRVRRSSRERRSTSNAIRPSLIGALEFRAVLKALEKKSTQPRPIRMRRYSDDGRAILEPVPESQPSSSHLDLLTDQVEQLNAQSSPPRASGRGRTVSANDATSLEIDRNLIDLYGSAADTAIYSPGERTSPGNAASGLPRITTNLLSSQPSPEQSSPNLLLSTNSVSSGATTPTATTPASMTATRNGLLAPPEPGFIRPDYTETSSRLGTSDLSMGAISPLALAPRLQIPHSGQKPPQEWRYLDSPAAMSSPYSRPPSIHLPPPSMSPESSHVFPLPEDEGIPIRQLKWWPYRYMPSPEDLFSTLFPGLYDWSEKRWPDRILALCTAPSIFLLTITVPVVETKKDPAEAPQLMTPLDPSTPIPRSPVLLRLPTESPGHAREGSDDSVIPQITTDNIDEHLTPVNKGWNRWLSIVHAFTAPLFMVLIMWANVEEKDDTLLLVKLILGSLAFSLVSLAFLLTLTSPNHEPKHKPILCFLGFFVAIAWISTIAGEVVGVLKAFGVILDISDAILGLTIFAVGNSLGDLVADITVARLGYPMMALSACFGGPMLNILLGIGIGGLYQTLQNARHQYHRHPNKQIHYKPYELDVSTTLLISGATLLMTLTFLLIVVPLNKWRMDRKIGVGLIAIWVASTTVNVILEVVGIGQTDAKKMWRS